MVDVATMSIAVAIVGCLVGVAGWLRNTRTDERENGSIRTKLDFIGSDVKDVKASQASLSRELQDVKVTADTALSRANAANDRLDAMGARSASVARMSMAREGRDE